METAPAGMSPTFEPSISRSDDCSKAAAFGARFCLAHAWEFAPWSIRIYLAVPALPQPGPYFVRLDRLREARVAALTPYKLLNALAITVCFVLAGCFADSAIGPCTLQIKANEQGHRLLERPYRVRLGPGSDPTVLYVSGTGWMQANIVFRHSSGYENSWQLTQQDITGNTTGFPVNRAGQWQIRMSDP